MNTLTAYNVCKYYTFDSNILCVLDNISYSFTCEIIYGIIGESGTGKTTLLNLLSNIDIPTSGNIFFNNININSFSYKEKNNFMANDIGIIFQEPYLIKELTILENIMLKGLIKKIKYKDCKDKAYDLLSKIGLEQKANHFPDLLSRGQQQRISILRAIFNEPKFLIADEPTSNLDKKCKSEIMELLISYKNEHKIGLIIATHDNYVISLCNKKLILKNCKLKE